MELGAAIIRLEADASSVMGQIKALRGQVEGETGKVAQGWDKSWSGMGGSASSVLRGIAGVAGVSLGAAGVVGFLKGATSAALEFDNQMDKVASRLSGADFGMLGELGAGVEDMSVKFGAGTKGLTDGLTDIIDSGIPASEAMGVLDNSVLLAKGHVADTAPVITSVTSILRGFKIEAEDSGHVVDVLANTADHGRGSMVGLAGAVGSLAPYAEQAGFSLEETAAAVSTLTREGVPLEKTGIALKMMFINLAEAQEKGIVKSTTLAGALSEVSKMQEKDRDTITGSNKSRSEYNILLQQSAGYARDLADATDKTGVAQDRWNRISGEASHKMNTLKEAAGGFMRTVGEGITTLLDKSGVLDGLTDTFINLSEAIKGTGETGELARTIEDISGGAADAVSSFEKTKDSINGLLSEYANLTKELSGLDQGSAEYAKKQEALSGVMEKIGRVVPSAITAFGKYGEVLAIDTDIASDFIASQQEVLQATLRLKEAQAQLTLADIGSKRAQLLRDEAEELEKVKNAQAIVNEMTERYHGLVVSDPALKSGYTTAVENLNEEQAALAKTQVQLAEYRKAEAELAAVKDVLSKANSGEISSNDELVKKLQEVTSGTEKAGEADKGKAKTTREVVESQEELAKALKKASDEWGQYYKDQERLSGWSRDEIISDIEAEIRALEESGKKGGADWEALWKLRKQYTEDGIAEEIAAEEEARQAISDIWIGVSNDIKSSMSDAMADVILGNESLGDSFKNLGNRIKESFVHGFTDSLIEKAGFDNILEGNIFGMGGLFEGLGGTIVSSLGGALSSVTDFLGITSSAAAGLGEGLGEVTIAAGETGAALDFGGAVAQIEAAEAASAELASSTAVAAESWDTMGEVIEEGTGAALEQTTALTESSKGLFSTWGAGIATVGGLATGLIATYVGASKMSDALKGGDGAARQFAAGLGNIVAPATMALSVLGETGDVISAMTAGAVIGTNILPGLGTVLGGLAGAAASFAEGLGIGGSHVTFEEEFKKYLEDFANGAMSQEALFAQVYLRMTNYATDFWGTQGNLLEADLETRREYYEKFADLIDSSGSPLFSEEQLSKMRDALQLSTDEAEKAAMAVRTSFEVAGKAIDDKFWNKFKDSSWMLDILGDFGSVWDQAVSEAQASGGDVWAIFEQKMMEIPGMTAEIMGKVKESIAELRGEVDLSVDTAAADESFDHLADALGIALGKAGKDIGEFASQVESVANKWLQGWDIDLGANLKSIPGMSDEYVGRLKEELKKLKESGTTTFTLDEDFENRLKEVAGNPDLWEGITEGRGKEGKGGKDKIKYGGLLVPKGEMLAQVMSEQVIPSLAAFVSDLTATGQGFANLNDQQASSVLNLIGAEDNLANRQSLMGQTAEGTSAALNALIASTYGTAEGTGALGSEYDSLIGKIGGFAWGDWMLPLNWQQYVKEVNLANFVAPVDLNDFAKSSGRSASKSATKTLSAGGSSVSVVFEKDSIRIGRIQTEADAENAAETVKQALVREFRNRMAEVS